MNNFIIFLDIGGVLEPMSESPYSNINSYFESTTAQTWIQTLDTSIRELIHSYIKSMNYASVLYLQEILSDIRQKGYTPECVLISLTAIEIPISVWNKFFSYIAGETINVRDVLDVGKDKSGGYSLEESLRMLYKGIDIYEYLAANEDTVSDYLILDDDCQILPENIHRYYKTNSNTGLVESDTPKIKKLISTKGLL